MLKKMCRLLVLLSCLALPGISHAGLDPAAVQAAHKLFITLDMRSQHYRIVNVVIDEYAFQNPNIRPYKNMIKEELLKKFTWASIEPDMAKMFASQFTAKELNEINAFYSTPTGKKLSTKFVNLMLWSTEIGRQKIVVQMRDVISMYCK